MRTLRLAVFVSTVTLLLALSPGFSGQAPPRTDPAAPAKGAEAQPQPADQTPSLEHLAGHIEATDQAMAAAATASQAAGQNANLVIWVVGFLFTLVTAVAGVLAFFGFRNLNDLRRQAEQSAASAAKSAKAADEYVNRMNTLRQKAEDDARPFASLDPTKDMPPALKQQLADLSRRLELFEALGLPLDADACLARGNDYFSRGDYASALACYDRAAELKPGSASAHYKRGLTLGRLGRWDESLAAHDRAIALEKDHPSAHRNRGVDLQRLGRHEEALAALDRAIQLNPCDASARFVRVVALIALGRIEEANGAFDRLPEAGPDDGYGHYNRACALARLGRRADALAGLREAVRLDPKCKVSAKTDPDFESLRSDPDFQALVGPGDKPPA